MSASMYRCVLAGWLTVFGGCGPTSGEPSDGSGSTGSTGTEHDDAGSTVSPTSSAAETADAGTTMGPGTDTGESSSGALDDDTSTGAPAICPPDDGDLCCCFERQLSPPGPSTYACAENEVCDPVILQCPGDPAATDCGPDEATLLSGDPGCVLDALAGPEPATVRFSTTGTATGYANRIRIFHVVGPTDAWLHEIVGEDVGAWDVAIQHLELRPPEDFAACRDATDLPGQLECLFAPATATLSSCELPSG